MRHVTVWWAMRGVGTMSNVWWLGRLMRDTSGIAFWSLLLSTQFSTKQISTFAEKMNLCFTRSDRPGKVKAGNTHRNFTSTDFETKYSAICSIHQAKPVNNNTVTQWENDQYFSSSIDQRTIGYVETHQSIYWGNKRNPDVPHHAWYHNTAYCIGKEIA